RTTLAGVVRGALEGRGLGYRRSFPCDGWRRRWRPWLSSSSSIRSIAGEETASLTKPQQIQVLYEPYQSRSIIIDPPQRGQVRGRAACTIFSFPSGPPKAGGKVCESKYILGTGLPSVNLF